MPVKSVHAFVSGRVQRVYYRASLHREAVRLGLVGFVRNLPDGRVEYFARGPAEAVDELLAWSRSGPPMAEVSGLERTDDSIEGEFQEFAILR